MLKIYVLDYVNPKMMFTLIGDSAFTALDKMCPGQRVLLPRKRRPGKGLADEDKEWNKYVGSRRVYVEHGIGRCKRFKVMPEAL